jgi:OFA family oxalate/formate antiporter-like MFS transporter
MAKTSQYWKLFSIFTVGAMAGLMVIGIIGLFGKESVLAKLLAASPAADDKLKEELAKQAAVVAGTAMGLFYALFNGFGRIIWGWISDKIGRRSSIAAMTGLQGLMMIALYFIGGSEAGLYLAATIIGFNFGGNFALFPAATADFFGNKSVGTNYPWVFMAYGVGGIIGPILGGVMGDAKAWMWAFIPAGIACIVASVVGMTLKPPKAKSVA